MPEVASEPANDTPTAWLYQPFVSGGRAGLALTLGGVASYLRLNVEGALTLPALSVQVPLTVALPLSGPLYAVWVHEAIPEVGSEPENVTVTGALYQPFPLGAWSGDVPVTVGASLSMLNWR